MKQVLIGFVAFIALTALALLAPPSLAGEMSTGEMTAHGPSSCASCPPTEQLTAAGMLAGDELWYVNLRFAVPPLNSTVRLSFAGAPDTIELQQTGRSWRQTGRGNGGAVAVATLAQRDNQLVVGLPAALRANGLAVATGAGDRIPGTGYVAPQYDAAPHFNIADAVLLGILGVTVYFGFKHGALREAGGLLAMIISVLVAAVSYKPFAAAFTSMTGSPRAGAALGSGLIVVVVAVASGAVLPRLFAGFREARAALGAQMDGALGSAVAAIRQLVALAMILAVSTDAAVLHWAARSINASLIGSALLHAWRSVFSA